MRKGDVPEALREAGEQLLCIAFAGLPAFFLALAIWGPW